MAEAQPGGPSPAALNVTSAPLLNRAATAVALVGVCAGASACGGSNGDQYVVRAIFDSAQFVNPGLEVRTAGVPIGEVTGTELTDDNRAAVRNVAGAALNLVGLAAYGEKKAVDKVVDGLKFHE